MSYWRPDDLFGDLIPGRQPRPFAQPSPGAGAGWMQGVSAQGQAQPPVLPGLDPMQGMGGIAPPHARPFAAQAQRPDMFGRHRAQPPSQEPDREQAVGEMERYGSLAYRMGRAEAD